MSKRQKQFVARLLTFLALALGSAANVNGRTYTYDAENHLTGMSASGTAVTIVYDAFGNRVAKTLNGVTTRYLVEDDVNPTGLPQVMEEILGGSVERTYTYGLQRISQDQLVNGTWTPSFYGYDGAGTVRQLTDAAGTATDIYDYDAYGNAVNRTGSTPNNYLYRAEQYDPDLGLYYLNARYYNPSTGRFLSRDPQDGEIPDPKTLHKYLYAGGDPVNAIDPMGREEIIEYQAQPEISGLQAHHVIERRFGKVIAQAMCTLAAVLTVEEHQAFTNAWRARFPYGMNYSTLTAGQIFEAAEVIYADWPEIDAAAKRCRVLAGI